MTKGALEPEWDALVAQGRQSTLFTQFSCPHTEVEEDLGCLCILLALGVINVP